MSLHNDTLGRPFRRRMRKWQRHLGTTATGLPSARDLALLGNADPNHLFDVRG